MLVQIASFGGMLSKRFKGDHLPSLSSTPEEKSGVGLKIEDC